MPRPKLPANKVRSVPVFVLLRPDEVRALDAIVDETHRSRSSILRDSWLRTYARRLRELPADVPPVASPPQFDGKNAANRTAARASSQTEREPETH